MFEEEYPSPGLQGVIEGGVLLQLSAMGIFSAWALGGAPIWVLGYLACLGWLTPVTVEGHIRHGGTMRHTRRRFVWAMLPFLLSLVIFLVGLFFPSLVKVEYGNKVFYELVATPLGWPSALLPAEGWLPLLASGGIYCSAVGLVLVAVSVSLLRRLLLILSLSATGIALFGYLQLWSGTHKLLFSLRTDQLFFGTFPHAQMYAGFALIWTLALFGLILHLRRHRRAESHYRRWGFLLCLAWAVLASSVFLSGAPLHSCLLFVGIGWCLLSEAFYTAEGGQRRQAALLVLVGLLLAGAGGGLVLWAYTQGIAITGLPWSDQLLIWRDAWSVFLEKPIFGWGQGSFLAAMALHQSGELGLHLRTAHNDLLHLLVEQGIVGLLIWLTPAFVLARCFLAEKAKRLLSAHLWVAVIMVSVLAIFSFPLQSPATAWSLWLILAVSYAWLRVQRPKGVLQSNLAFDHNEMRRVARLPKPRGETRSRLEERND